MATITSAAEASKALRCQTWVLKVSIHCQGCKRKVQKVLQSIHGVHSTTIDLQHQRVTVTGNIEAETLIKKLIKTGKHAEIWPEKPSIMKQSSNANERHEQKKEPKNSQDHIISGSKKALQSGEKERVNREKSSPNSVAIKDPPAETNRGSESESGSGKTEGKQKKKKGEKGFINGNGGWGSGSLSSGAAAGTGHGMNQDQVVGTSNLPCPEGFFSVLPPVNASSYNMAHPSETQAPSYFTAPSPFTYQPPSSTLDPSFYVFSDENVSGCSIV